MEIVDDRNILIDIAGSFGIHFFDDVRRPARVHFAIFSAKFFYCAGARDMLGDECMRKRNILDFDIDLLCLNPFVELGSCTVTSVVSRNRVNAA